MDQSKINYWTAAIRTLRSMAANNVDIYETVYDTIRNHMKPITENLNPNDVSSYATLNLERAVNAIMLNRLHIGEALRIRRLTRINELLEATKTPLFSLCHLAIEFAGRECEPSLCDRMSAQVALRNMAENEMPYWVVIPIMVKIQETTNTLCCEYDSIDGVRRTMIDAIQQIRHCEITETSTFGWLCNYHSSESILRAAAESINL
jgi:hypothetical protein